MSINIIEIENNLYDRVCVFTHESIYKLIKRNNIPREEIKIMIPEWLLSFLSYQIKVKSRFLLDSTSSLYGVEILPHYQNEVVVFYKKFSVNNEGCFYKLSIDEFFNTKELAAK